VNFEIVSFIVGTLPEIRDADTAVVVAPAVKVADVVRVRAVALPMRTYYRMDGQVSPDGHLSWPAGEILFHAGLSAGSIGIYGILDREHPLGDAFVPLRVAERVPGAGAVVSRDAELVVRTLEDLDWVGWRFFSVHEGRCHAPQKPEALRTPLSAGDLIRIHVPTGVEPERCIELQLKRTNDDRLTSDFFLLVTRRDDG
jgi:hypothetical protein